MGENGNGHTRTEKFNQVIRGVVVLVLTGGLTYGFVVSKVVSTETFAVIASVVFTWWFKSRDDKDADKAPPKAPEPALEVRP